MHELQYTKMNDEDGDIGIITNGRGLAQATADLIHVLHGKAANLLSFSSGSAIEDTLYSLDLMEFDDRVNVIFINVFGGGFDILKLVDGIFKAKEHGVITKPLVLRLRGLYDKEANALVKDFYEKHEELRSSIYLEPDIEEAAI